MNMLNKGKEMKLIFFTLLTLSSVNVFAVCATPISRTNIGANSVLTATRYNADVNTAYNRANNLPGDCVVDGSITTAKIANGAVTSAKIADGAVTLAKVASGAIPEARRLLRVSAFTSSGTWTKGVDVGAVLVQAVGGGGASYSASATNGSASSFGTHCVGGGGFKPVNTTAYGVGGVGSNGDINLTGGIGETLTNGSGYGWMGGYGGTSMIGNYGRGGAGAPSGQLSSGGGAGGYCAKLILAANLGATEAVTIGAGGTNVGAGIIQGNSGIVIVYEYSL